MRFMGETSMITRTSGSDTNPSRQCPPLVTARRRPSLTASSTAELQALVRGRHSIYKVNPPPRRRRGPGDTLGFNLAQEPETTYDVPPDPLREKVPLGAPAAAGPPPRRDRPRARPPPQHHRAGGPAQSGPQRRQLPPPAGRLVRAGAARAVAQSAVHGGGVGPDPRAAAGGLEARAGRRLAAGPGGARD